MTTLNARLIRAILTLLTLAALTLIALTAVTPTGDVEYDLVIVAGILVDGTGAQPAEQVAIAIRGDRIADIIPVTDGQIPRAHRVVRATGATVPPGLINACAHVEFWSEDGGREWIAAGVTTVADIGSPPERLTPYRQVFASDGSPRLMLSGPALVLADHHTYQSQPNLSCAVSGASDAIRRIKQLTADCAPDFLLVGRPWRTMPQADVIAAAVRQAGVTDRPVLAWVDSLDSFRLAVEGGAHAILSIPAESVPSRLLQRAVDQGMLLVPGLGALMTSQSDNRAAIIDNVRRFHSLGGRIAFGDDAGRGIIHAGMPLRELELLQTAAGLSGLETITAATAHSAAVLGLGDDIGTVELGKLADLVVVAGNPAADLTALNQVQLVVRSGRIVYESPGRLETVTARRASAAVRTVHGDTVILAGRMIDGTGREPQADVAIVIRDGQVYGLYPADRVTAGPRTEVIDARDCTVLPGMFNAHVHLTPTYTPQQWTQAGITTLIDLGANRDTLREIRQRFEGTDAPRLLMAGPLLTAVGGYPLNGNSRRLGSAVRGPEDATQQTLDLIDRYAVEVVKIAITDCRGWMPSWMPRMSSDESRAIINAAHSRGVRVFAHIESVDDLLSALEAGVDVLAHAPVQPVSDAVLLKLIDREIIMVPTLSMIVAAYWWSRVSIVSMETTRRFFQLGGMLALGDDLPVPGTSPPGLPINEILLLEECGLSGLDIITAATRNAAAAAGLQSLGTIEIGKCADLVIIHGDPSQDISVLGSVHMVLREGQVVFRAD